MENIAPNLARKQNISQRLKSVGLMVGYAFFVIFLGVFSNTDFINFIPKWTNAIFAIVFLFSTCFLIFFIVNELYLCYIKTKFTKDNISLLFIIAINIVAPTTVLVLSHYFSIDFKTFPTAKVENGMSYIYIAIIFLLPIVSIIPTIAIIETKTPYKMSNYNKFMFSLTVLIICAAFNGIFYIVTIRSFISLLLILIIAIFSDSGAYFFGIFFGKHKMAPVISPKKTWEGFFGGMFVALMLVMIILFFSQMGIGETKYHILTNFYGSQFEGGLNFYKNDYIAWWCTVPLVIIAMIVMSVYGDLYFSLVKRKNNIKDFSNVFPGHGGFLDRCDSIIFTVLFYFSVTLVISTISTIIYPDVNTIFNNSYFFNI